MSASEFSWRCSLDGTAVDPIDASSDFGDANCGEPEFGQHLMLDFTPDPEIDNEIVQKKICDFWNVINNMPEIQSLKVKPMKCERPAKPSTTTVHTNLLKPQTKKNVIDMSKSACSMLEDVEEKELITRAFEGKMTHKVCSLGEFKNEDTQQKKRAHRRHIVCKCAKPCEPCPVKKPPPSSLKQLCTKLEQWDKKHPKSMDPPGHPPVLQHCIVQRQVFEF